MRQRKKLRVPLLILLCAAVLSGTGGGLAAQSPGVPARLLAPISPTAPDEALFGEAVLIYSNAARRERGLAPLTPDPRLARVAVDQARNMAKLRSLSHDLPNSGQSGFRQRLAQQGVRYGDAAENIAMGKVYDLIGRPISTKMSGCAFTYGDTGAPVPIQSYASAGQEVVEKWLASPRHRASLLSPKFERFGAGVGVDPAGAACGDLYMAQDFAD